ncbi:hypothetical protein CHX26_13305 [Porphyrobacter sp. HT-58-2]|uniref:hypothetical protein n=1 Tax=Porphyrobacter sp. HT-58-2 TaxID=2023229 RepID=UPI000CDC5EAA|nr:hypothetical protein [Porphyrobacter sp. HT-58-2]AUX70343.1 hypothetical protein CHX26_13305 [Porphyrobacter sp. HT-58-2]
MKKLVAAIAIAAAMPVATAVTAPAALAQAEGGFEIPTPPEGKGQIIFYRTGGLSGAALGCAVFDVGAEDKLSSLGAGRYFVLVSEPGPRSFTVKSLETKDALTLEIEPDETQFVRCKIKSGFMSGRADIAPSTENEFRSKYKNPKLVDGDDMSEAVRATNYPQ